jgi:hypothetical protein
MVTQPVYGLHCNSVAQPMYETLHPISQNGTDLHRLRAADWRKGGYGV